MNYTYSQNSVAGVVAFAVQLDDAFVLSNSTQDSEKKTGYVLICHSVDKYLKTNITTDTV